jgi:hypothetical protein
MTSAKIIPGVYYEEIQDSVVDIQALPSGVVGIVGTADSGPLNTPTKLNSWEEFISIFGGWRDELTGPKSFLAVRKQGATGIYFSRIAGSTKSQAKRDFYQSNAVKASLSFPIRGVRADNTTVAPGVAAYIALMDTQGAPTVALTLTAIEVGVSEEAITVTVTPGSTGGYSNIVIAKPGFTTETYANVRVKNGDAFDAVALINLHSVLVRASRGTDNQTLDDIAATPLDHGVDGTETSVIFTAKQAGVLGNSIDVRITHGTDAGHVTVLVLMNGTSELYENVRLNGTGNRNLVALINANSSIVTVTQVAQGSYGQEGNPKTGSYDLIGGTAVTTAFTLTAKEYGKWGNSLKVSISNAIPAGYNITIFENSTVLEQFTKVLQADVVSTLNTSAYVTATVGTMGPLEQVLSVGLLSGDNGATTTDSDYIGAVNADGTKTGLYAMANIDVVTIMVAAQQSSAGINQVLVQLAEDAGDRISILSLQRIGTLEQIESAALITDSKVAVQAWPWKVVAHPVDGTDLVLTPAEFLAGTIAASKLGSSPSNKAIKWAYRDDVEFAPTSNEIARLIQARIIPAARKRSTLNPTGRYVWMAGITTTSSVYNKDRQIAIIAPYLNIVEGLLEGLDPYVSELNTPYLRASVRYSATSFLRSYEKTGILTRFSFVCDGTNNLEADARSGYLYCDVELYFAYPADYIILRVKKDPAGNISAA